MDAGGKKTAAAVLDEVTGEVAQWLNVLFRGRRKTGHMDLEASEIINRSAMRRVGAVGITQLLQFPAPPGEQRAVPCSCGHTARYQELRSKSVLTAVGPVEVSCPYHLCPRCHNGRFPADTGAIETAELFVRRLYTEAFERGRDRVKKKVALGDCAEWIWNIADQHFAGAIQIVDIWHAREHF